LTASAGSPRTHAGNCPIDFGGIGEYPVWTDHAPPTRFVELHAERPALVAPALRVLDRPARRVELEIVIPMPDRAIRRRRHTVDGNVCMHVRRVRMNRNDMLVIDHAQGRERVPPRLDRLIFRGDLARLP